MKTLLEWKKVKGEYSQTPSVEEENEEDKKVREKLDLDGSQLLRDLNPSLITFGSQRTRLLNQGGGLRSSLFHSPMRLIARISTYSFKIHYSFITTTRGPPMQTTRSLIILTLLGLIIILVSLPIPTRS